MNNKLKLLGVEASLLSFQTAGYLAVGQLPNKQRDALYIYDVLKKDAKMDGHVYVPFKKLEKHWLFKNQGNIIINNIIKGVSFSFFWC